MRNYKDLTNAYLGLQAFPQSENLTLVKQLPRAPLIQHVFQISKLMCFEESGGGRVPSYDVRGGTY